MSKPIALHDRLVYLVLGVFFCLCVIGIDAQSSQAEVYSKAKFVPPEGQVLLIIGQDKNTIAQYDHYIDTQPGGVMMYTSIQKMEGIRRAADHGGGIQQAKWLTDRFPDSVLQIGLYMVDALDMVVTGIYDKNITSLADFFKAHDRPFYLRIGYEFDNPANKYNPEKYIEAYRYIVNRLRDLNVNNVAYVWHAHGQKYARPQMDWYPGSDFVDWVAISFFSPFNTDGMQRVVDLAKELKKPLMIAESTPITLNTKDGEDAWKRWYPFVFEFIANNNVKAFCYINSHWDSIPMFKKDKWGDARVEQNVFVRNKWRDTVLTDPFMNASPDLFGELGYPVAVKITK